MAQQMQARKQRQASPERWQKAAQRAITEGIEVRQVNTSGMWVATSGTQSNVAYLLEITQGVVLSCSCPAGQFGDPCCKHAARFYLDAGVLEIEEPEPDPSGPAAVACWRCYGAGIVWVRDCERNNFPHPVCDVCGGTGTAPLAAQALALVAAAEAVGDDAERCDACGGPLDADAVTDDALQTVCGTCHERHQQETWNTLRAIVSAEHRQHREDFLLAA